MVTTIGSTITNLEGLEKAVNLKRFILYGSDYLTNVDVIKNFTKLEKILLSYSYLTFDFENIANMQNLKELILENISYLYNIETINNLPNLNTILFTFITSHDLNVLQNIQDRNGLKLEARVNLRNNDLTDEEVESMIEQLNKVKVSDFKISNINQTIDIGEIEIDSEKTVEFKDLGILLQNMQNPNSRFYVENLELRMADWANDGTLTINNQDKTITVKPIKDGYKTISIYPTDNSKNYTIKIKFKGTLIGDKDLEVEIPDENLKKLLLRNYDIDNDQKITDYDLKNMREMSGYNTQIQNFAGLEYATNLKQIWGLNLAENADTSKLQELTQLKSLSIYLPRNSEEKANIAFLSSFTNLTDLVIYKGSGSKEYTYDISGILNDLVNLKYLRLDIDVQSISGIEKSIYLTELNTREPKDKDLSYIQNLNDLTQVTLKGIENINLQPINSLNSLLNLNLTYKAIENISNLDVLEDNNYKITIRTETVPDIMSRQEVQEFINEINKLNIAKVEINCPINERIDAIEKGTSKTIKLEDLSLIIKEMSNPNSVFYYDVLRFECSSASNININNENMEVTINAPDYLTEVAFTVCADYGVTMPYQGNISLEYKTFVNEGDKENEINIPDVNLKEHLLQNNDMDNDGKITEFDLLNIEDLQVIDCDIQDITGLEYAKNLENLDLSNNQIVNINSLSELTKLKYLKLRNNVVKDISPLMNLENLNSADLGNNFITDITCFANRKFSWILNMGLMGNFIDFSNGSDNLRVIEEEARKDAVQLAEYGLDTYPMICFFAATQRYGRPEDFNNEVIFGESKIKQKLISMGLDKNNDGKLTRIELSFIDAYFDNSIDEKENILWKLDLSNLGISDLSGLEYLNGVLELDLSNNNISNIEPLKYIYSLTSLNLSHNNITDISVLPYYSLNTTTMSWNEEKQSWDLKPMNFDFSYNKITDISVLNNWIKLKNCISESWNNYGYDLDSGMRDVILNLSNNQISDISGVENWNTLVSLDLSNNHISNISNLRNYDFKVYEDMKRYAEEYGFGYNLEYINVANNNLDKTSNEILEIAQIFTNNNAELILEKEKPEILKGDQNKDGKVSLYEAIEALKYATIVIDQTQISEELFDIMDYDDDGKLTLYDVFMILRMAILGD